MLKLVSLFLIVAAGESRQFVDAVITQLNYAVDVLTNDCRRKEPVEKPFHFFSVIMETIPQLSGEQVLSRRGVFSSPVCEKYC